MRQQFFPETEFATIGDVRKSAAWSAEIIEADGGWLAFESESDAAMWSGQE